MSLIELKFNLVFLIIATSHRYNIDRYRDFFFNTKVGGSIWEIKKITTWHYPLLLFELPLQKPNLDVWLQEQWVRVYYVDAVGLRRIGKQIFTTGQKKRKSPWPAPLKNVCIKLQSAATKSSNIYSTCTNISHLVVQLIYILAVEIFDSEQWKQIISQYLSWLTGT